MKHSPLFRSWPHCLQVLTPWPLCFHRAINMFDFYQRLRLTPGAFVHFSHNCIRSCAMVSADALLSLRPRLLLLYPSCRRHRLSCRRLSSTVALTAVLAQAQSPHPLRQGYINGIRVAFVLACRPERAAYQRFGFDVSPGPPGLCRRRTVDYAQAALTAMFCQRHRLHAGALFVLAVTASCLRRVSIYYWRESVKKIN